MPPIPGSPRSIRHASRLTLVLAVAAGLACHDEAGDGAEHATVARAHITHSLRFASATDAGRVSVGSYSIGPITRQALRSDPTGPDLKASFESDPVEVAPGSEILLTTGMWTSEPEVSVVDRPRFQVDVVGPQGKARLLDQTGQTDFDPNAWAGARVSVPEAVGSPATFRFTTLVPGEVAELESRTLPLWGIPRIVGPTQTSRPNVLLVSFDTLRADHTDPYGSARPTTPFLSQLASRGALVEQFVSTYPTTLSSHWSMMSGLYPARHGIYPGSTIPPPHPPRSLAQTFHDAGYRTAAFTEGGFVHSLFGFAEGFELYHNGPNEALDEISGNAKHTFQLAYDWLSRIGDEPYFMFLHTYEVHTPYEPDPEYTKDFDPSYEGRWKTRLDPLVTFAINSGKFKPTDAEFAQIQRLYDAEIRGLDALFERLWQRLDEIGRLDDTIVVITSDHGEDFWEHHWISHGTTVYDPALLVPFIVVADGRVAPGARLACQRSQTDLMPTLLDMAGRPIPPDLDGRSMRGELERGTCDEGARPAYSELLSTFYDKRPNDLPVASIRQGGWKLIRHTSSGDLEAYDLTRDPGELDDLAGDDPTQLAPLEAELDAYLQERPQPVEADTSDLPQAVRDRLEALGYAR